MPDTNLTDQPNGERITSIVPRSLDDVWAGISRRAQPFEDSFVWKVRVVNDGSGPALEEDTALDPTFRSAFMAPGGRGLSPGG